MKRNFRDQKGLFINNIELIEQQRQQEKDTAIISCCDLLARVRELNKQNWVALQQKNKSLAALQRGIQPKHGVVCVNSPQCFPSINTQYIHMAPYPTVPQSGYQQKASTATVTKAPMWKTPARKEHCTIDVVQSDVISQSILNSSQPLQSSNENFLPPDPFKSPKRKRLF